MTQPIALDALRAELLSLVHQPNPTDPSRWDIAPGKHRAFCDLIDRLASVPAGEPAAEMSELVERLHHLVSLNEPRHGGPYQGSAAEACIKAMSEAASALAALSAQVERLMRESAWCKDHALQIAALKSEAEHRAETAETSLKEAVAVLKDAKPKLESHLIMLRQDGARAGRITADADLLDRLDAFLNSLPSKAPSP